MGVVQVCRQQGRCIDLYRDSDGHGQWGSASPHVYSVWRHDGQLYTGLRGVPNEPERSQ